MSKNEEIKERAKTIIKNAPIETIISDKNTVNKIYDIIQSDKINSKEAESMLGQIELYIFIKQKMQDKEKNYKYLKEIARELREQKVRRQDKKENTEDIIFKVNKNNKVYYFLTRYEAQEFLQNTLNKQEAIIELEENKCNQLRQLIKIIKEEF